MVTRNKMEMKLLRSIVKGGDEVETQKRTREKMVDVAECKREVDGLMSG
jgi:hypothetical protein